MHVAYAMEIIMMNNSNYGIVQSKFNGEIIALPGLGFCDISVNIVYYYVNSYILLILYYFQFMFCIVLITFICSHIYIPLFYFSVL